MFCFFVRSEVKTVKLKKTKHFLF